MGGGEFEFCYEPQSSLLPFASLLGHFTHFPHLPGPRWNLRLFRSEGIHESQCKPYHTGGYAFTPGFCGSCSRPRESKLCAGVCVEALRIVCDCPGFLAYSLSQALSSWCQFYPPESCSHLQPLLIIPPTSSWLYLQNMSRIHLFLPQLPPASCFLCAP